MSEEQEEIEIPKEAIDAVAYKEWYKLSKNPILNKLAIRIASDGTKISLHKLPHHLRKDIEHLPEKEQEQILTFKSQYNKVFTTSNVWKKRAFGTSIPKSYVSSSPISDRKEDLIELFGRMYSIEEVTKIVNEEWKIPIANYSIGSFKRQWIVEIQKKVEKHKATFSDLRLGIKRSRLEELIWLYNKRKDKYKQTESKEDYKLLLTTLEQIRKESEGDQLTVNGKLTLAYEGEIQQHLHAEVFKGFNLKEIILARVAARTGISVPKLVASLNNSYYNKYSGVVNEVEDIEYEPVFPSTQNYNFDKMEKLVEDNLKNEIPKPEAPKDEVKAKSLGDLLKEKLAKKQEELRRQMGTAEIDIEENKNKPSPSGNKKGDNGWKGEKKTWKVKKRK